MLEFIMTELKDWLNSINFNKNNLMEEDPDCKRDYSPYIINRCLSGNLDCITVSYTHLLAHETPEHRV